MPETPVDYDPFAKKRKARPAEADSVPVDYDPFAKAPAQPTATAEPPRGYWNRVGALAQDVWAPTVAPRERGPIQEAISGYGRGVIDVVGGALGTLEREGALGPALKATAPTIASYAVPVLHKFPSYDPTTKLFGWARKKLQEYTEQAPYLQAPQVESLKELITTPTLLIGRLSQMIPYIGASVAATILAGPGGGALVAYAVEGDSHYREALQAGADPEQARTEANVVGWINAAIEMVQLGPILRGLKIGKDVVAKEAIRVALSRLRKQGVKHIGRLALKAVWGAAREGLEEVAQRFTGQAMPYLSGRKAFKDMDLSAANIKKELDQYGQEFAVAALAYGLPAGVAKASNALTVRAEKVQALEQQVEAEEAEAPAPAPTPQERQAEAIRAIEAQAQPEAVVPTVQEPAPPSPIIEPGTHGTYDFGGGNVLPVVITGKTTKNVRGQSIELLEGIETSTHRGFLVWDASKLKLEKPAPTVQEPSPPSPGAEAIPPAPAEAKPPEPAPVAAKQAWEMTKSKAWQAGPRVFFDANYQIGRHPNKSAFDIWHQREVEYAIREGKPVPRAVLEEYRGQPWADAALAKMEPPPPAEGKPPEPVPTPPGWTEVVGRTRTKEGRTYEAQIDWQGKRIVYSSEAHRTNADIRRHEIAHIMIQGWPDKFWSDYNRYANQSEWEIKNHFNREKAAMDYGNYLRDPDSVNTALRQLFEKYTAPVEAKPPEPAPVAAKQPWEMTKQEFADQEHTIKSGGKHSYYVFPDGTRMLGPRNKGIIRLAHKYAIFQALQGGKPVPAEVLAEYPDLAKMEKPAPAEIKGFHTQTRTHGGQGFGMGFAQRGPGTYIALDKPFQPDAGEVSRATVNLAPSQILDPRALIPGTDVEKSRRDWKEGIDRVNAMPQEEVNRRGGNWGALQSVYKEMGYRAEAGQIEPGMPEHGRELVVWDKADVRLERPMPAPIEHKPPVAAKRIRAKIAEKKAGEAPPPTLPPLPAVEETPANRTSSIENAYTEVRRAELGLEERTAPGARTWDENLVEARSELIKNSDAGRQLQEELASNPRIPTDKEVAVLSIRGAQIDGQIDEIDQQLTKANEQRNKVLADQLSAKAEELRQEEGAFFAVTERLGTEAGRALSARQMFLRRDFSLATMERDARIAKGAPLTAEDSAKVRSLHRRIADLNKKLAVGDFGAKPRKGLPLAAEMSKLQFELQKAKAEWAKAKWKWRMANRPTWRKVLGATGEAFDAFRAIMTSFDMSALLRQGGIVVFGHPIRGLRTIPAMGRALWSRAGQFRIEQEIVGRSNYPLYQSSGLFLNKRGQDLAEMEEVFMSRLAEKIPGVAASERAYTTGLNRLRADSFDVMVRSLGRNGKVTAEEARAIANAINVATGRGNLGMKTNALVGLNRAFFAPRYVASRFEFLVGQPLWGGTWRTRRLIAKEYARFLIGLGVVCGLGLLAGGKMELDPRSTDFGKLRFGDTRVDLLAGLGQCIVLLARVISGKTKTRRGKVVPLRGKKVPYGASKTADVILRFLRTKLSPAFGTTINVVEGENVIGEPVTAISTAKELLTPMAFRDIYEAIQAEGVPKGLALGLLAFFGMGLQTYQDKTTPPSVAAEKQNQGGK